MPTSEDFDTLDSPVSAEFVAGKYVDSVSLLLIIIIFARSKHLYLFIFYRTEKHQPLPCLQIKSLRGEGNGADNRGLPRQ